MAVGTMDATHEVHIHTGGQPITGLRGMEIDQHGIVDLSFYLGDGTCTPWALQGSLPPSSEARKIWEHMVPRGAWATGVRVRTQPHFGIIDVTLQTCGASERLALAPSGQAGSWELVDGTQAPELAS